MTATADPAAHTTEILADRSELVELTSNMGLLVDARQWDSLQQLFTDAVEVDYTSLNGGEPQTTSPGELIGGWHQALDHLDATQHLIAGQVISLDGDNATGTANVQATHVQSNSSGGPIWTVAGRYDLGFTRTSGGWRISALTLTVEWATGNRQIMQLASDAQ